MLADHELLELANCDKCSLAHADCPYHHVHGTGNQHANLVIVGEAPGFTEYQRGEPFVGPSGKILRTTLAKCGYDEKHTYMTNALLCPVPEKKIIKISDLKACSARLDAELARLVDVRVILVLGASAATAMRGDRSAITGLNGRVEWSEKWHCNMVYCYHPAAVLRLADYYFDFAWAIRRAVKLSQNPVVAPLAHESIEWDTAHDPVAVLARLLEYEAASTSLAVVDLETNGLDPWQDPVLDIGIYHRGFRPYIISGALLHNETVRRALERYLTETSIRFVYHNGKFDIQFLKVQFNINAKVGGDTMLLHHCLDERSGGDRIGAGAGNHGLKTLGQKYCDAPPWEDEINSLMRKNKWKMADVPREIRHKYLAFDLHYTMKLWDELTKLAEEEPPSRMGYPMPQEVHDGLLMPASNMLARVEMRGIRIDTDRLDRLIGEYDVKIATAAKALEQAALLHVPDREFFNPNSPLQVLYVLRQMGYKDIESTDEATLNTLKRANSFHPGAVRFDPFLDGIIDYRTLKHTKTTYLDGIKKRLERGPKDGRLRGSFLLHGPKSGRLSSRDPNMQNIPTDSVVKELFIPSLGYVLCNADFKQLEVRVLYWYCRDSNLHKALHETDFHWANAERVWPDITERMITADALDHIEWLEELCRKHTMFYDFAVRQAGDARTDDIATLFSWMRTRIRRQAKYVTFGVMYREGAESLARYEKGLGVPISDAAVFIKNWQRAYPTANLWLDEVANTARQTRWVESASGRRRRFGYPRFLDAHIVNEAVNHPIQALAGDINTLAMIRLDAMLPRQDLGNVLNSVHDSILAELRYNRVDEGKKVMRDIMTGVLPDDEIVFDVDLATGQNWAACH